MRLKAVAFYNPNGRIRDVFTTRKSATGSPGEPKEFYFVYPEQLKYLSYAQAIDLEMILKHAYATN